MKPAIHKDLFDTLVYLVSFGYPLTAVPQIIKIYSTHSAHDLSLSTWVLYAVFELILVIYGIRNKLKPVIIQGVLWIIAYSFIVVAIHKYGG